MDPEELAHVERALRELALRLEIRWVLDAVDEAIVRGISQERVLNRRRADLYDPVDVGTWGSAHGTAKGPTVVTTRPMTARERVQYLIEALRHVLVELPAIEEETLKVLVTDEVTGRAQAETVSFVPEDEDRARQEALHHLAVPVSPDRRTQINGLLDQLLGQVLQ